MLEHRWCTGTRIWVPQYIYGSTDAFLVVREWSVVEGRTFTPQESASAAGVCLIGTTIERELFGSMSPLGQAVRVNNTPLVIIGVLDRKGRTRSGRIRMTS